MSLLQNILPSLNRGTTQRDNTVATDAPPTVKPAYRINETAQAYHVTVHLPGVAKDAVEITADASEFRLVARRAWSPPAGWTPLHRETSDAAYELVLTHDNAIDPDAITAEFRDGVLRLSLPKSAVLRPRKIAVS